MTKNAKIELGKQVAKEIESSPTVGVLDISSIPASLLLRIKKDLRGKAKFIYLRKKILEKVLLQTKAKDLVQHLGRQPILVVSSLGPIELSSLIQSNYLKLPAKPGMVAPEDIVINEGPTSLPAGPALSELKQAGIEAKISEGKIAISKSKVLVKKGEKIKPIVAKALQKLEILPFEAKLSPVALLSNGIMFTKEVLDLTPSKVEGMLKDSIQKAVAVSLEINYPTKYNAKYLVIKGVRYAVYLGIEKNLYEKGIIDKVLAKAYAQALLLSNASKIEG